MANSRRFTCLQSAVHWALPAVLCLVAALWAMQPMLTSDCLTSTLPTGADMQATVPLLNTWTIWWNADRLQHGFADYWHAPIFFPERGSFAFSEPQPATIILAPWILLGGSPVLAYKIYLILALTLNGVFAADLLRRLKTSPWITYAGAAMVLFLPIVHQQIDVLQLIPLWTVLWVWTALTALLVTPTIRNGISTGVALGLSFWISIHMAIFLCILLCAALLTASLVNFRRILQSFTSGHCRQSIAPILTAVLTAAILILPIVLPMRHYLNQHKFERSEKTVAGLSARPLDYLRTPKESLLGFSSIGVGARQLNPGWTKLLLCVPGLVMALRDRSSRQLVIFLCATLVTAFLLSLGSRLQVGTWNVWESMRSSLPGFSLVRNVFRFAYFVQLVVVIFACCGIHSLWNFVSVPAPTSFLRKLLQVVVISLGILGVVECPPPPVKLAGVPDATQHAEWMNAARENLTPGKSLLCLPFAKGLKVHDLDATARWMYLQMYHGLPMQNGYSGFFPASWFRVQKALNRKPEERGGDVGLLAILKDAGTDLVVVGPGDDIRRLNENSKTGFSLEPVYRGNGPVEIYRLIHRETP